MAFLAQTSERGAGGVRQPAGRCDQLGERGAHGLRLYRLRAREVRSRHRARLLQQRQRRGLRPGQFVWIRFRAQPPQELPDRQAQFGDGKDGFLFGETPVADGKKKFFNLNKKVTDMRVKPAGEWNTFEVTAVGKVLTLWVNGAVTCQFEDCGQEKGFVGLEGEGYRIEFRNLKIKPMP